jgi:hypothetical protein
MKEIAALAMPHRISALKEGQVMTVNAKANPDTASK